MFPFASPKLTVITLVNEAIRQQARLLSSIESGGQANYYLEIGIGHVLGMPKLLLGLH